MLTILFAIYVFHCIRKLLSGNFLCRGLSCGDDDNDEEQAAAYERSVAPNREYQQLMNETFKNYYMPYVQDVSGMWNSQGKPLTEKLGTKLTTDLNTPWNESEMKSVYDKIWQQAQERTASQWAPIEQQTSQRLAGAGALDTGAALKTGNDIAFQKYKSNESLAIEQAIQEYNVKAQAKQQSYSNVFSYLNQTSPNSIMGQVGSYSPEVIPEYIGEDGPKNWELGLSKMMSIADPGGSYLGNYQNPKQTSGESAQSMQNLGQLMQLYASFRGGGSFGGGSSSTVK